MVSEWYLLTYQLVVFIHKQYQLTLKLEAEIAIYYINGKNGSFMLKIKLPLHELRLK